MEVEKRVRMLGMVILIITLLFFIASIIVHEYKKSGCQKVKGVVVDRSYGCNKIERLVIEII